MSSTKYNIFNDPGRLAMLRMAADDLGTTAAFDRLTRLAASVMDTPIVTINLFHEGRLETKSSIGMPAGWKPIDRLPATEVVCVSIQAASGPVTHIGKCGCVLSQHLCAAACAGVPLKTADGHILGTFCALDTVERTWSEDQIARLVDLGQCAVSELELRTAHALYSRYARDLAIQNEHQVAILERQHRTEEQILQLGFDATARERAETARRQIESILGGITDGFFALDTSMRFTYINGLAERLLHRTRGELIDTRLTDHPTQRELVQKLKALQSTNTPVAFEFHDEEHNTFFEILAYPSASGMSVYFHDVTDRKKAVDEIERRSAELQALSRRLVEVQEQERGQIARELHDEVGQILTGLKLTLSAARRLPDAARDVQLDKAQQLVNELIGHVRDISLDLRPAMLDDLGLLPTLLWHFERYTSQSGIEVVFSQAHIHERFNQAVETAAYRIVQEALTNVARYSKAAEVLVTVHNDNGKLRILIQDEGIGFDPVSAERPGRSNGVTGMRERVNLLGGEFSISSAPGKGATIRAAIPFTAEQRANRVL